jgi:hypothetical protein
MHVLPAVHIDRLSGDEVCIRRGQEKHGSDEVFRLFVPLERPSVALRFKNSRGKAVLHGLRDREPRCYHIYRDPIVSDFTSETAREPNDPGLRCHLVRLPRHPLEDRGRSEVDDAAPSAPLHQGKHRAGHQEITGQVDVDRVPPLVGRHLFE